MWQYYSPRFAFETIIADAQWPWAGHKRFAYDLVRSFKPYRIVELGTYYGTSFFSFGQAVSDIRNGELPSGNMQKAAYSPELHAIDIWEGDEHSGFYSSKVYHTVQKIRSFCYPELSITLHKKTFDEAVSTFSDNSIDLLHIDGLHTYEAVKHDFETWLPKTTESAIILFHDIAVEKDDFGVYKLWKELQQQYKTYSFLHSNGLGVLFKNPEMAIWQESDNTVRSYYAVAHKEALFNEKVETANFIKHCGKLLLHGSSPITYIRELQEEQRSLEEEKQTVLQQIKHSTGR